MPVKYSSVGDVKNVIVDLEKKYKKGLLTHKEVGQKAMIIRVRLGILLDKGLGNVGDIKKRHDLICKYCDFLKRRTAIGK